MHKSYLLTTKRDTLPDLKNQKTTKDRNKMGHLNMFSDQYVQAIFTQSNSKEIFKKRLQVLIVSKSQYLKKRRSQ